MAIWPLGSSWHSDDQGGFSDFAIPFTVAHYAMTFWILGHRDAVKIGVMCVATGLSINVHSAVP